MHLHGKASCAHTPSAWAVAAVQRHVRQSEVSSCPLEETSAHQLAEGHHFTGSRERQAQRPTELLQPENQTGKPGGMVECNQAPSVLGVLAWGQAPLPR